MNIFDGIERLARQQPDAFAIIEGDRVMTFGQLVWAVRHSSAALARQGVSPGDVVGILRYENLPHLLLTLALARCGAISLFIHPEHPIRNPRSRRQAIAQHYGVKSVIADSNGGGIEGCRLLVAGWGLEDATATPESNASSIAAGDRPWRICLTSGTTGVPKGVAQYHAKFQRICSLRGRAMGLDATSRFLCRMAVFNTPVLIRVMTHLLAGNAVVFEDGGFEEMFDVVERHRITHAFISPSMLSLWLNSYPARRQPLAVLRHLAVGGGRLHMQLARMAMARITPHVFTSYGSTESGAIARGDPDTMRRAPESVGRVVPWTEVQVVDDADRPLPAGEAGFVRVRGEEVATGYYGGAVEADGTAKSFRNGWFYPGDIGRLTEKGLLFIEERVDDVVNLGGPKVNTRGIEDALASHALVAEAAVFGAQVPDGTTRLVAAVVLRGAFDEQSIARHLQAQNAWHPSLQLFPVRELPRNAMGKVMKRELANRVALQLRTRTGQA